MPSRETLLLALAGLIFLGTVIAPPALMDDVDSAYAQIARQMLESGDWVTARLNGVKYFDKPPGQVWAMAASFAVFGVHDWAARIPLALACVALCWVTARFGRWAFGAEPGVWAGVALACSVGLWLFSRVRIPDPALTLFIAVALYLAMRLLEDDCTRPHISAALLGASLGAGVLWKGLPAIVFPGATLFLYLSVTRSWGLWRRLRPGIGFSTLLLVAAPWHIAAILQNPPYFHFSMESREGVYHGFFWRYFINEHVLRYLGLRYPKDYNTVPQTFYWLGHLLWLFPFSVFLPVTAKLRYRATDRAGRVRILCLCWLGFVLVFFALSTSQEYYTMAAYPAFALLLGDAVARGGGLVRYGRWALAGVSALAGLACLGLLLWTASITPEGDIAQSLSANPEAYTLALGHMQDLTIESFAWLRGPLAVAALAFLIGAVSAARGRLAGVAVMMLLFFQAARWAMVSFDPYLSSKPLADAYLAAPPGRLVLDDQYYSFSSVVFYTNQPVLVLNGRVNNIEYGSNAPDAPDVFLDNAEFQRLWESSERLYLATFAERVSELPPGDVVASAGGKVLLVNR